MKNEVYKKEIIDGIEQTVLVSSIDVEDTRTIEQLRKDLIAKVDLKTNSSILQGFGFDNHIFSMSTNAQINWTNLPNLPDHEFPYPVSTKDNGIYYLQLVDKVRFYETVSSFTSNLIKLGNIKKEEIYSATTKEELYLLEETI